MHIHIGNVHGHSQRHFKKDIPRNTKIFFIFKAIIQLRQNKELFFIDGFTDRDRSFCSLKSSLQDHPLFRSPKPDLGRLAFHPMSLAGKLQGQDQSINDVRLKTSNDAISQEISFRGSGIGHFIGEMAKRGGCITCQRLKRAERNDKRKEYAGPIASHPLPGPIIFSGRTILSNSAGLRNPSSTAACLSVSCSLKAFFATLAALS